MCEYIELLIRITKNEQKDLLCNIWIAFWFHENVLFKLSAAVVTTVSGLSGSDWEMQLYTLAL